MLISLLLMRVSALAPPALHDNPTLHFIYETKTCTRVYSFQGNKYLPPPRRPRRPGCQRTRCPGPRSARTGSWAPPPRRPWPRTGSRCSPCRRWWRGRRRADCAETPATAGTRATRSCTRPRRRGTRSRSGTAPVVLFTSNITLPLILSESGGAFLTIESISTLTNTLLSPHSLPGSRCGRPRPL